MLAQQDHQEEEEQEQEESGPLLIARLEQFGISAQDCQKLRDGKFKLT